MTFLVSPDGELWDVDKDAVHHRLGYWGDTDGLVTLATGDLGFVAVTVTQDRALVRLRPDRFSADSFEMVVGILVRRDPRRIVVDIDDARVVPQIFGDIEDAVAYLAALRRAQRPWAGQSEFSAEPLDIGRLKQPHREALLHQFRVWHRRRGRLAARDMTQMRRHPLDSEQLFARIDGERIVPESWPGYMTLYEPGAAARIIGKPFAEHDDGGFMQRAGMGYLATHRAAVPHLELVEATISPPFGPPRRLRYERLLLPWRAPGGESFVSTISYMRSKTPALVS